MLKKIALKKPPFYLLLLTQCAFAQEISFWIDDTHPVSKEVAQAIFTRSGSTFELLRFFKVKPRLKLTLTKEGARAVFSYPDLITIPLSDDRNIDPTLIHEITHAYFVHGLMPSIPGGKEANAIRNSVNNSTLIFQQQNDEIKLLEKELKRLKELPGEQNSIACEQLQTELLEKMKGHNESMAFAMVGLTKSGMNQYLDIVNPYAEFFSDLVAALALDDPKAISKTDKSEFGKYRDFSLESAATGWTESQEYVLLHPAGNFIWKNYIAGKTLTTRQKRALLEKVAKAIERELTVRLENRSTQVTPEAANLRLIENLQKRK